MNHDLKYYITLFVILGIGTVIIQSQFVPFMEINVWRPDLVLIIVLFFGKRFGSMQGSTTGFILGIIQDALTSMPIGISALPKTLAGYAAGKIKSLHLGGNMYLVWFVLMIFIHELIVYLFLQFKSQVSFPFLIYSRVFPNTIYTTVMLFFSNVFLKRYFNED
jgi:rod shape-determining protein MreD